MVLGLYLSAGGCRWVQMGTMTRGHEAIAFTLNANSRGHEGMGTRDKKGEALRDTRD